MSSVLSKSGEKVVETVAEDISCDRDARNGVKTRVLGLGIPVTPSNAQKRGSVGPPGVILSTVYWQGGKGGY